MSKRKAPPLESPSKRVKPTPVPTQSVIKVARVPPPKPPTTPRRVRRLPTPTSDSEDELDVIQSFSARRVKAKSDAEDSPIRRTTKPAVARTRRKGVVKTGPDANHDALSSTKLLETRTLRSGKTTPTTPTKPRSPKKPVQTSKAEANNSPKKPTRISPVKKVESPKKAARRKTPLPPSSSEDSEELSDVPESREPSPSPLPRQAPAITPLIAPRPIAPLNATNCLDLQKRQILRVLQHPLDLDVEEEGSPSRIASQQLSDLLSGTVERGEGNSCMLVGPRGSGKTSIVDQCIAKLSEQPIVLRLCGWTQQTDKLAIREIAYQLGHQTGKSFLVPDENQGVEENHEAPSGMSALITAPAAHLPALISVLPTLARPTVVILDALDLFAQHPRQSLLYCLLDTVQSCRAGTQTKGLAVIGVTSRIDTLNMLEKRVKSRFSGRMFRTAPPVQSQDWLRLTGRILASQVDNTIIEMDDWKEQWTSAVQLFLNDPKVCTALKETFSLTKDVRVLVRLLISLVVRLSPSSPFPTLSLLETAIATQRSRPPFPMLHALPYPSICLLIATVHSQATGHPTFTFEMLYERVRDQIRSSTAAPVLFHGSSIGMPQCSRSVLLSAFEGLVSAKAIAFVASSAGMAKEFVKYRAVASKEDIKRALQVKGDVNLTKWFTKATQ
ncbi:AAA domain-containing protein [Mycena indigotica]|uniref:AAA domain-containing protein n=1 Tax=Mycena indigotica TaxID=2126181 RepID=A0A8H6SV91_9AGAR|nr:AAA domain-containing protein [Mycena indigotica]KAF7306815.1 AAA domain-containing protein [Mycena indigotica]